MYTYHKQLKTVHEASHGTSQRFINNSLSVYESLKIQYIHKPNGMAVRLFAIAAIHTLSKLHQ